MCRVFGAFFANSRAIARDPLASRREYDARARNMRRDLVPKIAIAVVASLVMLRAATARPPDAHKKAIDDKIAREAYREITSKERTARREAAVKFPCDPWSQDDDFHERESEAEEESA